MSICTVISVGMCVFLFSQLRPVIPYHSSRRYAIDGPFPCPAIDLIRNPVIVGLRYSRSIHNNSSKPAWIALFDEVNLESS